MFLWIRLEAKQGGYVLCSQEQGRILLPQNKEDKVKGEIKYIGVDDTRLDLFEGQYEVPQGVSYNSYVILDEKVAVLDTVDKRCEEEWLKRLKETLQGRKVDYLILHHLEPDHAGSVQRFLTEFPEVILVGNVKTFQMLPLFLEECPVENTLVVKEGDALLLGEHRLTFYMAPMVHWPEVMVSYEENEQVLFSADAFGKFGALSLEGEEDWACEARRYYFNIVGKYGAAVQTLLKKLQMLEVKKICPLHGPILTENLAYYVDLYDTWSSYRAETKGVLVAYASFHGNTAAAAEAFVEMLREKGCTNVVITDLSRADMAEAIEDAFRYDRMVLAATSYEGGLAPAMGEFLQKLQSKGYQKRTVGIIENGSWAPCAGKAMKELLSSMKEVEVLEPVVTIRATMKKADCASLKILADAVCLKISE